MNLRAAIELFGFGTTEGALKAWDTRGRKYHPSEAMGVHLTVFDRSKHPNQYLTDSKKFFRNPVPGPVEREKVGRAFLKAKQTGMDKVTADDVTPMQRSLINSHIERVRTGLENGNLVRGKRPAVFKFEGKKYVMDGHHRLAYDSLGGRSTDVRVFE
jgi:hypothetical protein